MKLTSTCSPTLEDTGTGSYLFRYQPTVPAGMNIRVSCLCLETLGDLSCWQRHIRFLRHREQANTEEKRGQKSSHTEGKQKLKDRQNKPQSSIDEKDTVIHRESHTEQVLCECWEMFAPEFHVREKYSLQIFTPSGKTPQQNHERESDRYLI
jgi:hypothetical protein